MPRSASFASLIQKLVRDQVQRGIQGCLMQPVARRRRPRMDVGDAASGTGPASWLQDSDAASAGPWARRVRP